jgi:hypothetical protein
MLLDLNEKLEEENSSAELQHSNLLDEDLNILEVDESTRLEVALSKISSDVPRGDGTIDLATLDNYWLGMVWAIRSHNLPDGEQLARQWSMQSDLRFTEEGFKDAWNAYDSKHENPIGIGSLYRLASHFEAGSSDASSDGGDLSPLDKLKSYSATGDSAGMRKQMSEDRYLLKSLAIVGHWTNFFAAPNTGKTLIVQWLLREQIAAGEIEGRNVFFVNADDHYRGAVEKLEFAEKLGMNMLIPNHRRFKTAHILPLMKELVDADQARGVIFILDTLKKFTDLMDKKIASQFGEQAREFVLKGGSVIGLAHVNKHPDELGRSIHAGTSDIPDDADCNYIIDKFGPSPTSPTSETHTVEFTNKKRRGDVAQKASFRYTRVKGSSYAQLLDSVERLDPELLERERAEKRAKHQLARDEPFIDVLLELIAGNPTISKSELVKKASKIPELSQSKCRELIDKYSGEGYGEFARWKVIKGENNKHRFELLIPPGESE